VKSALVMLAFTLLSACASGGAIHFHAQAASATRDLLEQVRVDMGREQWADVNEIRESGVNVEAREKAAQAYWAPMDAAYEAARSAHTAYLEAVRQARDRGDTRLAAEPARALLGAWVALAEAGDAIGVHVSPPPPALLERVKEDP
jgi:hypothetical protein